MARIQPYVAKGAFVGQNVDVKVNKFVWIKVGQGEVAAFSDYEVRINGKINVLGYDGDLTIHLVLADENPSSKLGSCCLTLNSYTDENAKYTASGGMLTVSAKLGGKKQNISILPTNNGTQTECQLKGHVNETVHLDPS